MKKGIFAFLAFLLGSFSGYLFLRAEAERLAGGRQREAVQLVRGLTAGAVLARTDLRLVQIPEKYWDPRAMSLESALARVGKPLSRAMVAGAFLIEGESGLSSEAPALVDQVRPGLRAYLLHAEQNLALDGVRPGDRIDIVLVSRDSESAEVLLENVEVLAGKDEGTKTMGRALGLPLSVRPEEALRLMKAEARGKFRILLRNPNDPRMGIVSNDAAVRTYERGAR